VQIGQNGVVLDDKYQTYDDILNQQNRLAEMYRPFVRADVERFTSHGNSKKGIEYATFMQQQAIFAATKAAHTCYSRSNFAVGYFSITGSSQCITVTLPESDRACFSESNTEKLIEQCHWFLTPAMIKYRSCKFVEVLNTTQDLKFLQYRAPDTLRPCDVETLMINPIRRATVSQCMEELGTVPPQVRVLVSLLMDNIRKLQDVADAAYGIAKRGTISMSNSLDALNECAAEVANIPTAMLAMSIVIDMNWTLAFPEMEKVRCFLAHLAKVAGSAKSSDQKMTEFKTGIESLKEICWQDNAVFFLRDY
jgi:hypothetical protein